MQGCDGAGPYGEEPVCDPQRRDATGPREFGRWRVTASTPSEPACYSSWHTAHATGMGSADIVFAGCCGPRRPVARVRGRPVVRWLEGRERRPRSLPGSPIPFATEFTTQAREKQDRRSPRLELPPAGRILFQTVGSARQCIRTAERTCSTPPHSVTGRRFTRFGICETTRFTIDFVDRPEVTADVDATSYRECDWARVTCSRTKASSPARVAHEWEPSAQSCECVEPATTRPDSYARTTAWTRSRRPSFARRLLMCVLTVCSVICNSPAISTLDSPRARARKVSVSRRLSPVSRATPIGAGRLGWTPNGRPVRRSTGG
jgi:hypothetical protein